MEGSELELEPISSWQKCGKTVPQLGEQAAQSIPPLVVPTHESTSAGQLVITDEHRRHAEMLGITVGQLLDIEPMSPLREEEIKTEICPGPTFGRARGGQEPPNENV